jgi:hypothetical protein
MPRHGSEGDLSVVIFKSLQDIMFEFVPLNAFPPRLWPRREGAVRYHHAR